MMVEFLCRCDGDGLFFSKRSDIDVFWTHITSATDAIMWIQPSLTMTYAISGGHQSSVQRCHVLPKVQLTHTSLSSSKVLHFVLARVSV